MGILTLVRHGQASYMSADYDRLSPLGELQSKRLAEYWIRSGTRFDKAFCGPAKRHRRTAELILEAFQQAGQIFPEPTVLAGFDEFDAFQMMRVMLPILAVENESVKQLNGRFLARQDAPEAGELLQELFEAVARIWSEGHHCPPEIESWSHFRGRVERVLEQVRNGLDSNSSALVVTSAGPISAAIGHHLELSHSRSIEFVWMTRNTSYTEFVVANGRSLLSSYNVNPHLDESSLISYR